MKNSLTSKQLRDRIVQLMADIGAIPSTKGYEWQIITDLGLLHIHLMDDGHKWPLITMKFEDTETIKYKFFQHQAKTGVFDVSLYGLPYGLHSGKWNLMLNRMSVGPYKYALWTRFLQQINAVVTTPAVTHELEKLLPWH